MVVSRSGAVAVIAFDEVGTKKVELTACLRKRLLRWPPPRTSEDLLPNFHHLKPRRGFLSGCGGGIMTA